jgi:uncharacterized protein YbaP (TraB family)
VERYLSKLAKSRQLTIKGLEDANSQLKPFDKIAESDQIRMLEEALEAIESGEAARDEQQLTLAWENADQKALTAIATKVEKDSSVTGRFLYEVLLLERNKTMASKLLAMLQQQDKLVAAVGAMHLLGKGSIPELLSVQGVKVERIY